MKLVSCAIGLTAAFLLGNTLPGFAADGEGTREDPEVSEQMKIEEIIRSGKPADASDKSATASTEKLDSLTATIKIGTDIQEMQPIGVADSFTSDSRFLIGWSEIDGLSEPTHITHVWKREGTTLEKITLPATPSENKIYSKKSIDDLTGEWSLDVLDANGNILGSQAFQVRDSIEDVTPLGQSPELSPEGDTLKLVTSPQ